MEQRTADIFYENTPKRIIILSMTISIIIGFLIGCIITSFFFLNFIYLLK